MDRLRYMTTHASFLGVVVFAELLLSALVGDVGAAAAAGGLEGAVTTGRLEAAADTLLDAGWGIGGGGWFNMAVIWVGAIYTDGV